MIKQDSAKQIVPDWDRVVGMELVKLKKAVTDRTFPLVRRLHVQGDGQLQIEQLRTLVILTIITMDIKPVLVLLAPLREQMRARKFGLVQVLMSKRIPHLQTPVLLHLL